MRRRKVKTRGFWANRWEAAKRAWRKLPSQEWSAEMLPQGVKIHLDSWFEYRQGWRETVEVDWSEISKVIAYKTDEFSVDTIWLGFESADGDSAALPEDAPQWKQLVSDLPVHLKGCQAFERWYPQVAQPPFETNYTVLYGGSDREVERR